MTTRSPFLTDCEGRHGRYRIIMSGGRTGRVGALSSSAGALRISRVVTLLSSVLT